MTKTSYGFLIERRNKYGTEHITCRVVALEDGTFSPINPRSEPINSIWDEGAPKRLMGHYLDGLCFDGFQSSTDETMIGFTFEYLDVFSIKLRSAKAMAKTLGTIDRALTKAEAYEPGDMLYTACKALGFEFCVEIVKRGRGSNYSDHDYLWHSIETGRNRLRALIREIETENETANA